MSEKPEQKKVYRIGAELRYRGSGVGPASGGRTAGHRSRIGVPGTMDLNGRDFYAHTNYEREHGCKRGLAVRQNRRGCERRGGSRCCSLLMSTRS